MKSLWGALAISLALVGSAAAAEKLNVELPAPISAVPLPAGFDAKPISLTRLVGNVPTGKTWAEVAENPVCITEYTEQWKAQNNQFTSPEFERSFREAFAASGLRVTGDPTNLFEESKSSDLQLGALITDVRARLCSFSTGDPYKGVLVMSVEWQVYSVAQGKVLGRVRTEGGYQVKKADKAAVLQLITGAFADNAKRLAANSEFRQIVGGASPAAAPVVLSPIAFAANRTTGTPINTAVKSVVTVFAGDGLGSGVLISGDGYILTNHHVAGDTGQVRIRWADGIETVGQVVRADRKRDVALIKTSPRAQALALRPTPALLGETVFAIGTPLAKELAGTLTKGIVSSTRMMEGQPWIQSDVAITNGNSGGPLLDEKGQVLGLTSWSRLNDGQEANLNFFVPIDDALKVLAMKPAA